MPTERVILKNADGVMLCEERLYFWIPPFVIERSYLVSNARGGTERAFTSRDWADRYFRDELQRRDRQRGAWGAKRTVEQPGQSRTPAAEEDEAPMPLKPEFRLS